MAKVFLSLSGEGRGHATRIRAVAERLRQHHELRIFAPGDAHAFLAPLYRDTDVRVDRIPGLRFHYTRRGSLDYLRTGRAAATYLMRLQSLRATLDRCLQSEQPDLVITDFEPALPRAARRCGVPFVSLSHQHFLVTYDLRSLPRSLRLHAAYMGAIVRAYYSGQRATIVSSFFFPPLRRRCHQVTQVGVLLRPEVTDAVPETGDHVVAYFRRFAGPHVLDALASARREVRVYGLGARPRCGNLVFRAVEERRFIEDLAGAAALVATAGNQLVGEALWLGKPSLVMPETANYEQYINAHFLRQSGAGDWSPAETFSAEVLDRFLAGLDGYRSRIDARHMNGLPATLRVLERFLPVQRALAPAGRTPAPVSGLAAAVA